MNVNDLAQQLADGVDIPKVKAKDLLKNLGVAVSSALKAGDEVTLPGIGKIVAVKRAARTGKNPATGAAMQIPEKIVPKLKPAAELKNALAG